MIKERLDLSSEEFTTKSNLIICKLKNNPTFINAKTIGIYVSFKNEVDTRNLIKEIVAVKNVCVPKVNNNMMDFFQISSFDELKEGYYGILEPISDKKIAKEDIDLLIIPMVAYDKYNNRLGYGGGFYDRYLANYSGKTIGLAFSFQKVEMLPTETFDLPIATIINEK